jgi:hypothetical protein
MIDERQIGTRIMGADGQLKTYPEFAHEQIGRIQAKRFDVGTSAKGLYDALVADFRRSNPDAIAPVVEGKMRVRRDLLDRISDGAGGRVGGALISYLDTYAEDSQFGEQVRRHARNLRELFAQEIRAIHQPLQVGAVWMIPFELDLADGKKTTAYFTGRLHQTNGLFCLQNPRAVVKGKRVLLCDDAATELLSRAGHVANWGADRSGVTLILANRRPDPVPLAVRYIDGKFRMLNAEDVVGGAPRSYHPKKIGIET